MSLSSGRSSSPPNLVISPADLGGDDKPAKDSLAYIQLEKQNERLKEALIKWAFLN